MQYVFIFLGNKLLSCDTILSFICNLKVKSKSKLVFYVFNYDSYNNIKKNTTLYNLININGELIFFGHHQKFKLLRRAFRIISIFYVIFLSLIYRTANIHFGVLDKFPFNLIYIFNRKNTFLFESNCWGRNVFTELLSEFGGRVLKEEKKIKSYSNLVCFSKDWPQHNFAKQDNKNIFLINSMRTSKSWLEACANEAKIIKQEKPMWLSKVRNKKKSIIFIVGYLGKYWQVPSKETAEHLFRETIKILIKKKEFVVLLKPHSITDMKKINSILDEYKSTNVYVVYDHVAVLSNFCNFAICNYNSLALKDVWLNGLKTIEYTCYNKKVLLKTKFKSISPKYVDSFINEGLKKTGPKLLEKELNKEFTKRKIVIENLNSDSLKLLDNFLV